MAELTEEQIILAAKTGNDSIFNSADNSKDFWRILTTQVLFAAREFVTANPDKKIEIELGTMLDKVKYQIFREAESWKKEGTQKPN